MVTGHTTSSRQLIGHARTATQKASREGVATHDAFSTALLAVQSLASHRNFRKVADGRSPSTSHDNDEATSFSLLHLSAKAATPPGHSPGVVICLSNRRERLLNGRGFHEIGL
jgi:hypothetical protein